MPLAELDYDYEYGFETSRYNSRRRNSEDSISRPRKKKAVYDYNVSMEDIRQSAYQREYNIPTGIRYKKNDENKAYNVEKTKKTMKKRTEKVEQFEKEEEVTVEKKQQSEGSGHRFNDVCLALFGIAIIFCILYRSSIINEKFNKVEKAKKELLASQTVNEQLQIEIDSETDLSYIENYAKYQLGMQKPQDSQIVYVNVQKQDRILTPVVIDEDVQESWFDNLIQKVSNVF